MRKKAYFDGLGTLEVRRCQAGLYVITNMPIPWNAIANRNVLQRFLDCWAELHGMLPLKGRERPGAAHGPCPLGSLCLTGLHGSCQERRELGCSTQHT